MAHEEDRTGHRTEGDRSRIASIERRSCVPESVAEGGPRGEIPSERRGRRTTDNRQDTLTHPGAKKTPTTRLSNRAWHVMRRRPTGPQTAHNRPPPTPAGQSGRIVGQSPPDNLR